MIAQQDALANGVEPSVAPSVATGADTRQMILRYRHGEHQYTYPNQTLARPPRGEYSLPVLTDPGIISTADCTLGRPGKYATTTFMVLADIQRWPYENVIASDILKEGAEKVTWSRVKTESNKATDRMITVILDKGFPGSDASYTLNPAMYQENLGDLRRWRQVLRAVPTHFDTKLRPTRQADIDLTHKEKAALEAWKGEHGAIVILEKGQSDTQKVEQLHAHLKRSYEQVSDLASIRTLRQAGV